MTEPERRLQDPTVEGGGPGVATEPSARSRFFRQVFVEHFERVCRNLRRLGVREREIEDSAHEVFIVVHRHLDDYDATRPLPPWLFGITLRVASDYRHRPRYRREVLDEELLDARAEGADPLDLEARWTVLRALEALSDEKRALLVMHDLEEYTMPEIAHVLGVPLNTAYSRLRLARADFRRALEGAQGHEGEAR
ncbi:MAG: polymerase sigma factor RpoE [Labilithrix sp.]|nr:polymerase sigma factor RpoE [Labilithrix sp.]